MILRDASEDGGNFSTVDPLQIDGLSEHAAWLLHSLAMSNANWIQILKPVYYPQQLSTG